MSGSAKSGWQKLSNHVFQPKSSRDFSQFTPVWPRFSSFSWLNPQVEPYGENACQFREWPLIERKRTNCDLREWNDQSLFYFGRSDATWGSGTSKRKSVSPSYLPKLPVSAKRENQFPTQQELWYCSSRGTAPVVGVNVLRSVAWGASWFEWKGLKKVFSVSSTPWSLTSQGVFQRVSPASSQLCVLEPLGVSLLRKIVLNVWWKLVPLDSHPSLRVNSGVSCSVSVTPTVGKGVFDPVGTFLLPRESAGWKLVALDWVERA